MTRPANSPAPRFVQDARQPVVEPLPPRRSRLAGAISSGLLLALSCFVAGQLRLKGDVQGIATVAGLVIGIALGAMRWTWIAWLIASAEVTLICLIAFTPMAQQLIVNPEPADPLGYADAVVALGAGAHEDGSPDTASEDRVLHAIQIVRLGYAKRIVLCGMLWTPTLRDMVHDLTNDCEVISSGPVNDTHDEALATARLARQRKWDRVIVVTEAWHMPRAAGVFRSAGVNVLRSPCLESRYDLHHPASVSDRLEAVKDWLHEAVGIRVYRWRGWITPDGEAPSAQAPASQPVGSGT